MASVFNSKKVLILALPWILSCMMSSTFLSCSYFLSSFKPISWDPIADLQIFPQSAEALSSIDLKLGDVKKIISLQEIFKEKFYFIWNKSNMTGLTFDLMEELKGLKKCYGENLLRRPDSWLINQIGNSTQSFLGRERRAGIIVHTTDLRKLPTSLPCFDSPNSPGEGFPFDYLQETQLYWGLPVLISHFSNDRLWAFVETSTNGHGWVKSSDVGLVSSSDISKIKGLQIAIFSRDGVPIYNSSNQLIEMSKIGTFLPLKSRNSVSAEVYVPSQGSQNEAIFKEVKVDATFVLKQRLEWTRSDIEFALNQFIGKPYGWGNFLGNRDCSGMIRDFYSLFHILLPPSSIKMLNYSKNIDVTGKSSLEKLRILEKKGLPFRTILYRKGHVGIYIGAWKGQPLMFHAVWGVKTRRGEQVGRNLVGKAAITTLNYGKELPYYDSHEDFLKTLSKIILLD